MRELTVDLGDRSYSILIGQGLLGSIGERMRGLGFRGTIALIQDEAVSGWYGQPVSVALEQAGFRVAVITVPSGEGSKCLQQLGEIYDQLAAARLDRKSGVVALGGGVIGDLAGFAAATYLRGIPFVQVPTTLLAQVDSSVGGKTGIDLPAGKNLVGAFHQPRLVLADLDTLRTLPEREVRAGLAEVIKYGVIADADFFDYLEANRAAILGHCTEQLAEIVYRSCAIKAWVVGQDEREAGLREILNYGHTTGHAVEAACGYDQYLHGEAVAIGMAAAGRLSQLLCGLDSAAVARIERLLVDYGLPTRLREPIAADRVITAMRLDKKAREGDLRFVLAERIGVVRSIVVSEEDARHGIQYIQPETAA